jgi:hypothetical protein
LDRLRRIRLRADIAGLTGIVTGQEGTRGRDTEINRSEQQHREHPAGFGDVPLHAPYRRGRLKQT